MEPAIGESLNRPLRLLSLDGGGIRGISELVILKEIMHRVGRFQKQSSPLPADYFDLICGTGTGGLIALFLGRLRLSVPEAINKYQLLAKEVFSEKNSRWKYGIYKASSLEKAIKDIIESKLGEGHADDRMFDTNSSSSKTFVCAVPARHFNNQPRLFRTWLASTSPGYNCTIWEAARATTAAPTFFKRISIGDPGVQEEFIDAGLGYNNPVRHLIEEAKREFGPERTVSCIVSIGTGVPSSAGFKAPGLVQQALPLNVIKVLASMATNSEAEASSMQARFQNYPGLYHRLNVERGLGDISLEEWEKLGVVEQYTMAYVSDDAVSKGIDVLVDALVGKPLQTIPLGQLDEAPQSNDETRFHFFCPSYQVLHYVNRKDPLNAIHQNFQNPPDKMSPAAVVLLGLGGCGKSQLALEYCRQGHHEGWFSAILWFDASSPISLTQSFAYVAYRLSKPNFDVADHTGNIRFVLDAIEAWKTRWLLVFDNFDNPGSFSGASITQYIPRNRHGSILVTSRHAIAKNLGVSIKITTLFEEEALQLLLKRSNADKTEKNLQEGQIIVKRLGYHALAIDQAGAYIQARSLGLDQYITHYSERKEKVLAEIPELWDYRRRLKTDPEIETRLSVFTTWELSIESLSGSPLTQRYKVHILTLAAFLDAKEVSDELFKCYASGEAEWLSSSLKDGVWDQYESQDILKELHSLSLLQSLHIGNINTTFSLHPMIQDWLRLRVSWDVRQSFVLEAILVLSAFLESQDVYNMTYNDKQAIMSHLEAVLQSEKEYPVLKNNSQNRRVLDAASIFALFLETQGRYALSEQMIRYTLASRTEILGNEHPDTLMSMNNLGSLLESQGKYDKAKEILRQTLRLREHVLGTEHPDTLASMNNLAILLQSRADYTEAESIHRQTLQLREMSLGRKHPDTLMSTNNLAVVLLSQGKYDEAEEILRQTLQRREHILGTEHPHTLASMNNLVFLLQSRGDYNEAEIIQRQTLQFREKVLGKEHPDTLASMNNLAFLLQSRDDYNEAEILQRQTLQLREKVLGKNHPATLNSMNNLALLLQTKGEYTVAEQIHRQTLQLRLEILGREHPDTLSSMRNLQLLLSKQGKHQEIVDDIESGDSATENSSHQPSVFSSPLKTQRAQSRGDAYHKAVMQDSLDLYDTDIQSDLSEASDGFSTTSIVLSTSAIQRALPIAIRYIVRQFINDPDLCNLYESGVERLSEGRFVQNHDRLLKKFFLRFRTQEKSMQEQEIIRILRLPEQRTSIAKEIWRYCKGTESHPLTTPEFTALEEVDQLLQPSQSKPTTIATSSEEDWDNDLDESLDNDRLAADIKPEAREDASLVSPAWIT